VCVSVCVCVYVGCAGGWGVCLCVCPPNPSGLPLKVNHQEISCRPGGDKGVVGSVCVCVRERGVSVCMCVWWGKGA